MILTTTPAAGLKGFEIIDTTAPMVAPPRLLPGGILGWIAENPGAALALFALALFFMSQNRPARTSKEADNDD